MSSQLRAPRALRVLPAFILAASAATPAQAGILDGLLDPPAPSISITRAATSGDESQATALAIKLSAASTKTVTVNYSLSGTAATNIDYTIKPVSSLNFVPGQTSRNITIAPIDDSADEADETVVLTISSVTNATLGTQRTHTRTIIDNDVAPTVSAAFTRATASGDESQPTTLAVKLSAASSQTVTVNYTVSGTATSSSDYSLKPTGPLSFAPGQTTRNITITPADDTTDETDETVVLTLASATNATLGSQRTHTRTIADNDEPAPVADKWVMGYYVGYARDLYPVNVVDFSALTHVVVGRVTPNADGTLTTNFDIDDVEGPIWAKQVTTAAHAAGKKAILMVGGFGTYDSFVAAASPANRARFIQNLVKVAGDLGFDGWDIDWEPIETADQPNFTALAQGLRAAAPGKLMTVPIYWVNANFPQEADGYYAQIAPLFDQINLMSYGMASGYWNWDTWHSSAVYGETGTTPSSIDSSVRAWLAVGVPAAKLGIGIGFYGSCWRGVSQPYQVMKSTDNTSGLPRMGNDDNDMSYTNIMTLYYKASAKKWHEAAKAPYLGSNTALGPQKCNFISYEDAQSIAEKALYVKQNGLGGAIVWTINQGYLPNAPAGQRDPLMQALKDGFLTP